MTEEEPIVLTPAQARRRATRRLLLSIVLVLVGGAVLLATSWVWGWWSVVVEAVGMLGLWCWQGWADARDRAMIDWDWR